MRKLFLSLSVVLLLFSCHSVQQLQSIRFKDYVVARTQPVDSSYLAMLKGYSDSVNKTMNEFLVENEADLVKETPNSSLGNFLADAYLWGAKTNVDPRAEIAFMNHGGVRINRLLHGGITRRQVYEVMPFDNILIVVEVKGAILRTYLDRIAQEGGGGGVAGLSMRIQDNKAVDILINGQPIDLDRTYYMVNSDYQVDGGGGFNAFRKLPQNRSTYLQRDAIIDYCKSLHLEGKKYTAQPKTRIRK